MSSLTSLPDIALTNILEHLDFKSILTLRHTCHDLRNFIDDVKPNSNVRSIHISIGTESINLVLYAETRFSKTYKEDNFSEQFLTNLMIILSFQRAPLEYMEVSYDYRHPTDQFISLEEISKILKCRPRSLSVNHFRLEIFNQEDVMFVLPFITTEKINISNPKRKHDVLELNNVVELDQWKQAKEIDIRNFTIVESLNHFLNFDDIFVQVETISLEDVVMMKDKCLQSSTTSSIRIDFNELVDRNRLEEVLGPKRPHSWKNWFIPIENSEFGVSIDLIKYYILFERSPRTIYNM
ncbi:hypothetical protein GCK72_021416 [Caenorhabditis remanei]|uniref:F-box domain-containing protein n=1 Tax=Caenorhabditis remanei TaxID=31234 RepID=A0A6A5GJR9_CAERE|nr:hypothetical protein GCK72_021416 [Caenorhabditis remanei]KAF1754851.1 hypothetical protein GCK72_021416 [Caenorhabditis remanei]